MFFSGNSFINNGKSSDYYGLIFASVNKEFNNVFGGDIEYTNMLIKHLGKQYRQNTSYKKPLSFEVEMITDQLISQETFHEINAWLFNQTDYKKLYINDPYYTYDGIYFNCYFTNIEKIEAYGNAGYGVYGFACNMICDAPWAWEDEKTNVYKTFTSYCVFQNTSDCNDYMYPKVTITTGNSGGTVSIQQVTDNNRLTTINNLAASETVTLSVNPNLIASNLSTDHFNDFNKKWPRFIVGENRFTVTGDVANMSIIYTNAREV